MLGGASMSALFPTYARWDVTPVEGNGAILVDDKGKEYLDFVSGIAVCNLGHCHPKVTKAVEEQLHKLWHVSNLFQIEKQEKVAKLITDHTVGDYVFFCNSGAEANEAAIKLARKATGRNEIVTLRQSFHGRTFATMTATGQEKVHQGFGPLLSGFTYVDLNDTAQLEQAVNEKTAAVMVEVIQGEGGVRLMDESYAEALKEVCATYDCLLIVDEIQTGIGRTGAAFAYEELGLSPDIITLAKGLGNGFPVGAVVGKKELKDAFSPGSHGSTFGGNLLAMAAAEAVLQEIFDPTFLKEVKEKGESFKRTLEQKLQNASIVKEIRGKGLLIGIECNVEVAPIITACRNEGLLVLQAGPNVVRILPPLTVTKEQIEKATTILVDTITRFSEEN